MGTMVDRKMPEYPAIVTALSSTHYLEGLQLVENVNTVVRKKYPKVLLIMFDIGLSTSQREEVHTIVLYSLLSLCKLKK